MEWFSTEESITKPEYFAPRDLGFVKLAIVVFSSRIYDWMKSVALSELAIEKDRGIIGARRFFATKDGLGVFNHILVPFLGRWWFIVLHLY
jgi:hypothetical protein